MAGSAAQVALTVGVAKFGGVLREDDSDVGIDGCCCSNGLLDDSVVKILDPHLNLSPVAS